MRAAWTNARRIWETTMRIGTERSMATGGISRARTCITVLRWLTAAALLLALTPFPAHAQLGRLKKLKQKFSAPDSAARAKDSLAQIAAGVLPESVKVGTSFLQKTGTVVRTANGALEATTGLSAKDAALAATGIGAGNLVAKKLGLDPMSIGQQAIANAKMSSQQRAAQKVGGVGLAGTAGAPGTAGYPSMDAEQMRNMQKAMGAAAASGRANSAAMANAYAGAGYSQADIDALMQFQQEMMQLSMAASAGDASAKARLESWEAIAMKYQPQMQTLSLAASTGDMAAVQKMQRMQFDLIKEWNASGSGRAKLSKAKKP
jgi:hypothetical protein